MECTPSQGEKNDARMSILVRIIRLQDEPKSKSTDTCMKYLCLMYLDETAGLNVLQDAIDKGIAECRACFDAIQQNGHLLGRNTLQPTRTATTVRVRDGKTFTTDGPFAETKEQLGGYFSSRHATSTKPSAWRPAFLWRSLGVRRSA